MVEEPLHARLDLHMKMVGVRFIVIRRQDIRENPEIVGLAYEGAELAGVPWRRDAHAFAACFIADLPLKMLGDIEPCPVALPEQADVDREACGVSCPWRRPRRFWAAAMNGGPD